MESLKQRDFDTDCGCKIIDAVPPDICRIISKAHSLPIHGDFQNISANFFFFSFPDSTLSFNKAGTVVDEALPGISGISNNKRWNRNRY